MFTNQEKSLLLSALAFLAPGFVSVSDVVITPAADMSAGVFCASLAGCKGSLYFRVLDRVAYSAYFGRRCRLSFVGSCW